MNLISYIRVSTKAQGESGLGLEAQQAAVEIYRRRVNGTIVKEYCEVESGRKDDRPALVAAIQHCQQSGFQLVVAKLDRLSRDVAFLANLMKGEIAFVCCDNPQMTPLTIHILAAVAEHEVGMISQRTKAALRAAKARGQVLGSRRPGAKAFTDDERAKGRKRAAEIKRESTKRYYKDLIGPMAHMRSMGSTYKEIADQLNMEHRYTSTRGKWSVQQVSAVMKRYGGD